MRDCAVGKRAREARTRAGCKGARGMRRRARQKAAGNAAPEGPKTIKIKPRRLQNRSPEAPKSLPGALLAALGRRAPSRRLPGGLQERLLAALWAVLALLGPALAPKTPPLGSSGRLLGCSWGASGGSWSRLGCSWGAPGGSWGRLGASWAVLASKSRFQTPPKHETLVKTEMFLAPAAENRQV